VGHGVHQQERKKKKLFWPRDVMKFFIIFVLLLLLIVLHECARGFKLSDDNCNVSKGNKKVNKIKV
jgi:hypothetical protein